MKIFILGILLVLLSGMSKGLADRVQFHSSTLPSYLQNKNYWNTGDIDMWKLKYKNNDPALGEKFFLSKSVLVIFTDSWHLLQFIYNKLLIIGTLLIGWSLRKQKNIAIFLLIGFSAFVAYHIGFVLIFK